MRFFSSMALAMALSAKFGAGQYIDERDCDVNPDPHFRTWDGTYYDFHNAVCDLVLVQGATDTPGGNDVDVQIRTRTQSGYSDVKRVAIKIGSNDAFESIIDDGGVVTFQVGSAVTTIAPTTYAGYVLSAVSPGTGHELTLPNGAYVRILQYGNSFGVRVHGVGSTFSDAVGMCGTWDVTGMALRNGTVTSNALEMGLDWQVGVEATDVVTFSVSDNTTCSLDAFPGCVCDTDGTAGDCEICGRNAGDLCCITEDEAIAACDGIDDPNEQANCIFDVETTGDVTWAESPWYLGEVPVSIEFCKDNGCNASYGKCVLDCDASAMGDEWTCISGNLCFEGIVASDQKGCSCLVGLCQDNGCKERGGKCEQFCEETDEFGCEPDLCGESPYLEAQGIPCSCKYPKKTRSPTAAPSLEQTCFDSGCSNLFGECKVDCVQVPNEIDCIFGLCETNVDLSQNKECACEVSLCEDVNQQCKERNGHCVKECDDSNGDVLCDPDLCRASEYLLQQGVDDCICEIPVAKPTSAPTEAKPSLRPTSVPTKRPTPVSGPPCIDQGCSNSFGQCVTDCQPIPGQQICITGDLCKSNDFNDEECACQISTCEDSGCEAAGGRCTPNCVDTCDFYCDPDLCLASPYVQAQGADCSCRIPIDKTASPTTAPTVDDDPPTIIVAPAIIEIPCYSADATTETDRGDGRGVVMETMNRVQVGDQVRVSGGGRDDNDGMAKVYGFGHNIENVNALYLEVSVAPAVHGHTVDMSSTDAPRKSTSFTNVSLLFMTCAALLAAVAVIKGIAVHGK